VIVNRSTAIEAAAVLEVHFETASEAAVNMQYRAKAKVAHPDGGGSLEKFAIIDRAKHILLEWLKRNADKPIVSSGAVKCPHCDGTGFVKVQRGFNFLRIQCQRCKGNGDLNYDYDKGTEQ
jgi:DnaJ-class molecular chaperone